VLAANGEEPLATVNPPAVQAFVLGGFRVVVHGQLVADRDWRRRSARQLFKALLSRPTRRMTRDEVTDLLWPDSDPDAASSNMRSTLHAMRGVLERAGRTVGLGIVFGDRDSVWLRTDVELWVDADAFERIVEGARVAPDPLLQYEQASALYPGDYLPDDLYEDWASARRDALKRTWTELQFGIAHQAEARSDEDCAIRALQRLIQADPCNERAAQELMALFGRYGRRAEALRIYQRLVSSLRDELDVEPSADSTELYRKITSGEASPPPPVAAAAFRCASPFPAPTELIGREADIAVLRRVLSSGRSAGQAALVGAPAGTGKSALLGQIVKQAQEQDVLCLAGGCYEERAAVPLGPFHDAIVDYLLAQPAERIRSELGASVDDLARVVPELRYLLNLGDEPAHVSPQADRMRVFGAIHAWLRGLAERGPTLLCLEDLHAADEATLQLFHYLARQTRRLPLVLIGTYRSDEMPPEGPLAQMLAAVVRERLAEHVRLPSLGRPETTRLVTSLLDGSASEPLSDSVYTSTGGNPLFVEQLLLALSEGGQLQQREGIWHGTTDIKGAPPIVSEVIAQRLQRLSASCRDTLATAAVLGRSVEHDLLVSAVAPMDEKTLLADLDLAIAASMLRETPTGYAFSHSLLRDTVYWNLSGPRRMLLHARAGQLLERLHGSQADDHAAELAYHFTLAGHAEDLRARALHYSLLAGRHAAELSSYPESVGHFDQAWRIVERDSSLADLELRVEVLSGRGWAEANMARYPECVASYRQVLALSNEPIHRGRARKVIAFSLAHTGAFRELVEECEAGLVEVTGVAGPEATEIRATLQQLIGHTLLLQGRFVELVNLGQRMVHDSDTAGPGPRMLAHKVTAWGYMSMGQVSEAIEQYEIAIAEAERWGEKTGIATAYETLGFVEYVGGRFAAAREHLGRSLAVFRDSATELRAAPARLHLCRVWLAEGEVAHAREQIVQALELDATSQERWAADAHHILGDIQVLHAEWAAATASFEAALRIRRRAGDTRGTVEATVALGLVDQCVGNWDAALARYQEAVDIANRMDPSPQRIMALRCVGRLRLLAGDPVAGSVDIARALDLAETMSETLEYAPTVLAMADLRAREGELDQAFILATRALERARPLQHLIEAHATLTPLLLASGNADEASGHAAEAVELAKRLGSPRLLSLAYLASAQCKSAHDLADTSATYEIALGHADTAGSPYERAAVRRAYAEYLRSAGRSPELASALEADMLGIAQALRLSHSEQTGSTAGYVLPSRG
jgi:DNA-binding SARP family transcriptional activator/predicted negative regulator of RcsB-dependent stress response